MDKTREQINFQIHYFVKPAVNTFLNLVYNSVKDIVRKKDREGWNSELVRKLRRVMDRFLKQGLLLGDKELPNYRPWVKQLFDLICLRLEVEEPLTSKRWEQLVKIAREEELI